MPAGNGGPEKDQPTRVGPAAAGFSLPGSLLFPHLWPVMWAVAMFLEPPLTTLM